MPVCDECRDILKKEIFFRRERFCSVCGKVLLSEDRVCMSCRSRNVLKNCDGVYPIFSYRLWNKNMVFDWKMNGRRSLTEFFSDMVYLTLHKIYEGKRIPAIVPVPPHKGKIRRKGWDQVEDLCFSIHRKYGLSVLYLLDNYSSEQQKKKNLKKRLSKSASFRLSLNFYGIKKRNGIPKEVILIDDVITTGATVNSCATVLKNAEVIKVNVLSLFIVD
ncbi:MAG: hypothetical protein K6G00_11580 [Treponema sp.]|nr:hypothetical protein [Treponema sp.]